MDAEDILNGLIRGALSGRDKPSHHTRHALDGLVNARTMLAAAGVAWGLYETWQQQQGQRAPAYAGQPGAGTPPPLPGSVPPATAGTDATGELPLAVVQLLRLMISAARADGEFGPTERERILAEAQEVGAAAEVERELAAPPRPVAEIVAGVTDSEFKEQLYALGYTIVRADETVTGGERIYLAQLANRLALDPATVSRLEGEVNARIEAARASHH